MVDGVRGAGASRAFVVEAAGETFTITPEGNGTFEDLFPASVKSVLNASGGTVVATHEGETVTRVVPRPTSVTTVPSASFITDQAGVPEHQYLDYSQGKSNPVTRDRYTKLGVDVARLDSLIDYGHVVEPEPNVTAINAAIAAVSTRAGGGIVRPKAATSIALTGADGIRMQDYVLYDGARIAQHDVRDDFAEAVIAVQKQDFAVLNVVSDAAGEGCYSFRGDDSRRYLVQNVTAKRHGQNSIDLSKRATDVTVRFCTVDSEREEMGGTDFRKQHGIVSKSMDTANLAGERATAHPDPDARFGMVYSHGHAYYSNIIEHTDGHGIDCHASNVESCVNWSGDQQYGHKYPHSSNVLVHHNRFGDSRDGDAWDIRFFFAHEYEQGIGYQGDAVFCFENRFDNVNPRTIVRIEDFFGELYMLSNHYQRNGTRIYVGSPRDSKGFVQRGGADLGIDTLGQYGGSSPSVPGVIREETNAQILALDPSAIIARMNAPKRQDWLANVEHPLPTVRGY